MKKTNISLIITCVILIGFGAIILDGRAFALTSPSAVTTQQITLGNLSAVLPAFKEVQANLLGQTIPPSGPPALVPVQNVSTEFPFLKSLSAFDQGGGVYTRCNKITSDLRYVDDGNPADVTLWNKAPEELKKFYFDTCQQQAH